VREVGKGSFGTVSMVFHPQNKSKMYALKSIRYTSDQEMKDIIAFLESLTGEIP